MRLVDDHQVEMAHPEAPLAVARLVDQSEPRRVCRRLQLLRGWSYDEENIGKIFT